MIPDPLYNSRYLYELYTRADDQYTGRVTVPILWDHHTQTIVNNESADIIRMLGSAFDQVGAKPGDYYPQPLRGDIDAVNQRVYDTVNNGVYKAGFATTQAAYEAAVGPLFDTLDWLEDRLSQITLFCGDSADGGRHPAVHHAGPFRCRVSRSFQMQCQADRRLQEPLGLYARHLPAPGRRRRRSISSHIKRHYYMSHRRINPTGIVPGGTGAGFRRPADAPRRGQVDRVLTDLTMRASAAANLFPKQGAPAWKSAILANPACACRRSGWAATISAAGSMRRRPKPVIHKALDLGITLFDTADVYGERGGSEAVMGRILGDDRKRIVLATKFAAPDGRQR